MMVKKTKRVSRSKKDKKNNFLYVIGAAVVIVLLLAVVIYYSGNQIAGKAIASYADGNENSGILPVTLELGVDEFEATFFVADKEYTLSFDNIAAGVIGGLVINEVPPPTTGDACDSDCGYGYICEDGECVGDDVECTLDSHCDAGYECIDMNSIVSGTQGQCVVEGTTAECVNDVECETLYAMGYKCVEGACVKATVECTVGDLCDLDVISQGVCTDGGCSFCAYQDVCPDGFTCGECPAEYECSNKFSCVEEEVDLCADVTCGATETCVEGVCIENIPDPVQCDVNAGDLYAECETELGEGYVCDADTSSETYRFCILAVAECGNNIMEVGEQCDGTDFGIKTCSENLFPGEDPHDGGELICAANCGAYGYASCYDFNDGICDDDLGETASESPADCHMDIEFDANDIVFHDVAIAMEVEAYVVNTGTLPSTPTFVRLRVTSLIDNSNIEQLYPIGSIPVGGSISVGDEFTTTLEEYESFKEFTWQLMIAETFEGEDNSNNVLEGQENFQ
jgi:hypothetical protein